ncbi:MAG: ferric reductase-like transmembrane domain-containing protein [Solirubrobacteraceae bacterium]
MVSLAAAGPSAYWYLTRGTGTIATILLTLSVAFGVANVRRVRTPSVPRFVFDAVHRNVSLLALAFVVVHVITSVLDSFAPISLIDGVIPFVSSYRPLWLGLGTVAFDLLLAVTITSLVRQRLGYRSWRAIHWAAYACWPAALLHGLGAGSDTKAEWMLAVVAGCVVVVVAAAVSRATAGWPEHAGARVTAVGVSALVPVGLLVWLPGGPLAHDWSRRAGTPASLLVTTSPAPPSTSTRSTGSTTPAPVEPAPSAFRARVTGTVSQVPLAGGQAGLTIALTVSGQRLSRLTVHLQGAPIVGGGIQMSSSSVTLGPAPDPALYRGTVTALQGTNIKAVVRDPQGHVLNLALALQIAGSSASGTVSAVTP